MLEARGLTKRYGGLLALDAVSFTLRRGEIVGYLGPNGSGKSTTVNIVVGLLEPTAGSIALNGRTIDEDPLAYKSRIGYVPEEPYLYTHLTATEYLTLVGRLRNMPNAARAKKIATLLTLFQLSDSRYSTMAAYSKGMRQRVLLAAALMHNPDLLVLDEPFSGLDVNAGLTSLETFLIGFPMLVVAFAALLVSQSLFPDETDARVLLALPVTRRLVFLSKLAALTLFVAIFIVAAHAAMVPVFLIISSGGQSDDRFLTSLAAHLFASLGASSWVVLAITGINGALLMIVPRSRLQTASTAVRSAILSMLVLSLPLAARLPAIAPLLAAGSRRPRWLS